MPRFDQDGMSHVWRARIREKVDVLLKFAEMYVIYRVECVQGPFNISPTKSMALKLNHHGNTFGSLGMDVNSSQNFIVEWLLFR